jgi:hypothetical protein
MSCPETVSRLGFAMHSVVDRLCLRPEMHKPEIFRPYFIPTILKLVLKWVVIEPKVRYTFINSSVYIFFKIHR